MTTAAAGAGVDGLAPLVTVNDYDMNIPEGNALGEDDRCFVVVGSGDAVLIPPHQSHVFTVTFTPADARTFSTQLRLGVVDNDFEATMLEVGGEGYIDDLSLDGLDMNDRLVFAPIPAGTSTTTHCTLINHSIDTLRYEFAPNALVTLTPAAGHIQGGQQVQVTAVLSAQAAIPNDEVTVDISVSKINLLTVAENSNAAATTTLANTSGTAWNKDQRTIRWEVREDAATGRLKKTQIEEPMPEPPHCVMAGTARVVPLYCRAVCDYPVVELGVSEVPFRDTALLQTRSYGLAVRNPGRVPAQFSFAIEDDDLVAQDGACPFTVDPQTGTVAPGETSVVTLRYAPTVVRESEAVLHCTVANCAPSQPPLSARLLGASTRPLCHIALGDGTSSGASGAVTVGANESDTKVLEFLAVGLGSGVSVTKKFPVVNPTDTDYHFHWVAPLPPPVSNQSALLVSLAGGSAAAAAAAAAATTAAANTNAATDGSIMSGEQEFVCQTMHGVIPANSQIMMTFVFTPTAIRTVDRTWTLHIAEHDVSIPVQLIGTAREPRVDLATASINFGMVTSKTLQTGTLVLVNDEAEAFNYAFDATQMDHISRAAQFELTPAAGKIAPHSRQVVAVRFTPLMSQVYDFAIGCAVKRKHLPLTARIQADVFSVSTAMTIDVTEGLSSGVAPGTTAAAAALTSTAMFLTVEPNAAAPLAVDLGSVYVGERTSRTAWLANTSRQPVTYEWSPTGVPEFTVEPAKGTVAPQGRVACVLAFQANRTHTLTRSPVSCRIANGPTYSVAVSARAQEPTVELSTSLVNFDKVFVVSGSMPPYERTVSIVNREREPISLRPIYNGPDILVVNCPATLVQPGGKIDAVLVFTPRTPLVLDATVHFEINSRTTLPLVVKGNGVPLRLQLEKPTDRNVAFGAVAVGAVAERQVILVNKSVLPVQFLLTADVASLVDHGLSVHPGNVTTLVPKASCGITVRFAPTGRLNPFSEEIALQCLSQMEPLLHVTGCCQAVQVELDMAQLAFGAVAVNSQCSRRVLMTNSGDIGARFKWNTVPLGTFFTVSPAEGYISAGREVPLTFTFMPKTPRADVRLEGVACTVEGSAPLLLDLTAVSVMPQPEKEVVQFSTLVRQTETRSVRITNPTGATWVLRPAFDHEFFSGAETVTVEAGATRLYDIHYMPLAMTIPVKTEKKTEEPKPHTGTLFMALPDGAALVYTLVGTALPPRPVALPQREVPCKVWYTESIAVTNWLKRPQRFRVVITKTRADAATVFKGMDYLDVPAGTTKDYKMQFFAYKEGVNTVEILFRNEQTTEFVSYEGSFRAGPPGVMDTVPLSSVVRQAVSHTITLDNPLPTPVTFTMTCQTLDGTRMPCPEIHSLPTFRIPARSENAGFTFEFLPVRAREFTCRLSLSSQELGVFQYDLVLTATAAPPLPAERLRVCLGDMTVRKFKFINFNPLRGEYAITVDSEEFSVPATITTSAAVKTGTEVSFDIVYEPTRLGDCRGTMTISSLQGGEYICPIFGQCQPPRPAGPFTVRAGDRLKLPFKNVFSTPETFAYVSDNTAFSIKPSDFIKSKETKEILVRYDAPRDELVRTGRLTVSCTSGPNAGTEWIFYLRGLPA